VLFQVSGCASKKQQVPVTCYAQSNYRATYHKSGVYHKSHFECWSINLITAAHAKGAMSMNSALKEVRQRQRKAT
jgi:hypothetical protein